MIKIVFLGGVEDIEKNCYIVETDTDMLILDCGLTYSRPFIPGTIYIMPDITYIEERVKKIRGCIITKAHPGYSGLARTLKAEFDVPLFATPTTAHFFNCQTKADNTKRAPIHLTSVKYGEKVDCGSLSFSLFETVKNTPEATGISISTPYSKKEGDIVYASTIPPDVETAQFPKDPHLLMLDSIFSEKRGKDILEKKIVETIKNKVLNTKGKCILPATPPQVFRFAQVIDAISKDKKIVLDGNEMKERMMYLYEKKHMKTNPETLLTVEEAKKETFFDECVFILTGSMEDPYLPLVHMTEQDESPISVKEGDIVLTPSTAFHGYERAVQTLYGQLSRFGVAIEMYDVNDSSMVPHATAQTLSKLIPSIQPKNIIPIHGYHYMLSINKQQAVKMGVAEKNTYVPNNGDIITLSEKGIQLSKTKAPAGLVVFQGASKNIGVSSEGLGKVIEERKILEKNGFFYIMIAIDKKTSTLKKSPDILTRGFVYIKESQTLIQKCRLLVKNIVETEVKDIAQTQITDIKKMIKKEISSLLQHESNKRPIVLIDIIIT